MDDGKQKLREALESLRRAQMLVGEAWADAVAVRTPRLADAASLMHRAAQKLEKEGTDPRTPRE